MTWRMLNVRMLMKPMGFQEKRRLRVVHHLQVSARTLKRERGRAAHNCACKWYTRTHTANTHKHIHGTVQAPPVSRSAKAQQQPPSAAFWCIG